MANDCIFCTLAKGNDRTIYEDDMCHVIPDRYPSEYGHLLIISKKHFSDVLTAPEDLVSHMFIIARKFAGKQKEKLRSDGIVIASNVGKEAGQIIFHFHIHVLPKYGQKMKGFMPHRELTDDEAQELKDIMS